MMSKKQWFVLLCVYVAYLLLGAAVFHEVESTKEYREQVEDKKERITIEELLVLHYVPNEEHTQDEIFGKLSDYCGRPLSANMSEIDPPIRWDYYHSLFFVITVVSTIGYGNLAPTTTLTRIFMIFYAIVGMPMNGMLIINLGDYFGKSFLKLYDRWKTTRVQHALATLGLVGQVVLYLIPGFTFFIFIPSIIIMVYEDWPYDVAVHYAFVTLTTIGFGDWVAGTTENDRGQSLYVAYKIFLLIWIISGLGYLCMVMGFVARGMQSKKMLAIEHKLALNIKRTNNRIREEIRSMVNEYLLLKVKRVYREKFIYVPNKPTRSQSCPDLTMYYTPESPTIARKRAFSTVIDPSEGELARFQSDSDLDRVDKEQTFNPSNSVVEPGQLLLRVANALGDFDDVQDNCSNKTRSARSYSDGINLFPSKEILANEKNSSGWSVNKEKMNGVSGKLMRPRAASEIKIPTGIKPSIDNADLTWYGPSATKRLQELREQVKYGKTRTKSLAPFSPTLKPQSLFSRLKHSFKPNKDDDSKNIDIESQDYCTTDSNSLQSQTESYEDINYATQNRRASIISVQRAKVLEETSIADFLRALTAISVPETDQQEFKTSTLSSPAHTPKRMRRVPIPVSQRRTSLMPFSEPHASQRRFSLRPEVSDSEPPPAYHPLDTSNLAKRVLTKNRRFSIKPAGAPSSSSSLQRSVFKLKYPPTQEVNLKDLDHKNSSKA